MTDRRRRVVILGGGVGALTAAFHLTQPGWEDHFSEITVYQQGWRLGGKGASGRNREHHDQIYEHGLHVWFGFYENAFRMMRACYEELGRPPGSPLATVDEAFRPSSSFVVQEFRPEGWKPWLAEFPVDDQLPGDPDDSTPLPSMWEYLRRSLALAVTFFRSALGDPTAGRTPGVTLRMAGAEPEVTFGVAEEHEHHLVRSAARRVEREGARAAEIALAAAFELAHALGPDVSSHTDAQHASLHGLLERAMSAAKRHLREMAFETDAGRRSWYVAEIFLACARGILRYGLLTDPDGFDAIDDFDFSDWLVLNGADDESARSSLVTTVAYDLAFAYREGDPYQPSFSAASALRGLFRLFFTYRGAIAWKMQAGMGDVVFAPLYEVLSARGVRFEFFRRVTGLHPTADGQGIESIVIEHQAELVSPSVGYRPLLPAQADALLTWPDRPLYDQLRDGHSYREREVDFEDFWSEQSTDETTLHAGRDFDDVVLGISVGALPFIARDLARQKPAWRRMVRELETVYTQSFQLWLTEPVERLMGKDWPDVISGGHVEPFDTFADMEHLIPREHYGESAPLGIAYFTNVMRTPPGPGPGRDDPDGPVLRKEKDEEARANALRYLREDIGDVWPDAVRRYPTDFRWELLYGAPRHMKGVGRFDEQYCRANVNPSDRYVLSLPGTLRYRLDPGASAYGNLVLAGDWTRCGLNSGCVEAAVISGMLAANALRPDSPPIDAIVGLRD